MRVLLLDQYFCPPEGVFNTQSYEVARRLAAAGHEVDVGASDACLTGSTPGPQSRDGISLMVLPSPAADGAAAFWPNMGFALKLFWRCLWLPKPDVVYAISPSLTLCLAGLLISLVKRRPFILEVRELRPAVAIALGHIDDVFTRTCARLLEWAVLKGADHIIAASDGLKSALFGKGVPGTKVTVVPGGADIATFRVGQDAGAEFLNTHPQLKNGPVILLADGAEKASYALFAVDLAGAVKKTGAHVHFVLMGTRPGDPAVQRAKDLGLLEQCVWVLPALARTELPSAFSAATLILSSLKPVPELHLNAPRTVFDAFAAARPIAITYGGWLEHLVDARAVGLGLAGTDIETAASELIDMLSDEVRLRRAGEAAAALADTRYNQDKLSQSVQRLLEAASE